MDRKVPTRSQTVTSKAQTEETGGQVGISVPQSPEIPAEWPLGEGAQ